MAGKGYRNGHPDSRAVADLGGARTILHVPLRKDEAMLGYISVYRKEVRVFSDKEIALLENFAAQAVIAMENARLINELREALEQQTATAEVLQVINASPGNPAPVFDAMLEKAMRLCGGTIGGIFTFDGGHSVTSAVRGVTAAFEQYNDKYPMDKIQPGTLPARIIEARGPVQNADVTAGEPYRAGHPYARALVELGGIRSVLAVPLLKDGVAAGMVAIYRHDVGTFSDKQIVLLQNFAAQAVIAMENARLITEQREALEQQTATAEVLEVINASPGNLVPVFDAMLEKAMRLCGAAFGSFYTYDGEQFLLAAQRGLPEAFAEFRARTPLKPIPGSQLARAIEDRQTLQVLDLKAVDLYLEGNPFVRAMVELGGVRTILVVPLCKDEAVLGFLSVYRQEVRAFSDKQNTLLKNFAAQAVIAMENARLIIEQREALEQQTATAEVLQVINASPGDLSPVFDAVLERALRLCGASFGTLATYDGEHIERVAFLGVPPAFIEYNQRNPLTKNAALIAQGIATGKPVQATDIMTDARMATSPSVRDALVELGGVRALLQVPMLKDGGVVGFIGVWRREPGVFPDKQIALLEGFAAQAVIAMENARLLTEQREALEHQTATADVLQVINASPGNLQPVFESILEKAHSLCDIAQGSLELYDGERFRAVAVRGLSDAFADMLRLGYPASDNPATRTSSPAYAEITRLLCTRIPIRARLPERRDAGPRMVLVRARPAPSARDRDIGNRHSACRCREHMWNRYGRERHLHFCGRRSRPRAPTPPGPA